MALSELKRPRRRLRGRLYLRFPRDWSIDSLKHARSLSKTQHVEHIVKTGRLFDRPARGSKRTPRKCITALSAMCHLDTLSHSSEDDRVVADNISRANGLNADFTRF